MLPDNPTASTVVQFPGARAPEMRSIDTLELQADLVRMLSVECAAQHVDVLIATLEGWPEATVPRTLMLARLEAMAASIRELRNPSAQQMPSTPAPTGGDAA